MPSYLQMSRERKMARFLYLEIWALQPELYAKEDGRDPKGYREGTARLHSLSETLDVRKRRRVEEVDYEPLVEKLRDSVRFLKRELDRRSVEAERCRHIVVAGLATANANLTDRRKELEVSAREPGASQEASGGSPSAAGRDDREDPRPGGEEAQEARGRSFTEEEPEHRGFWARLLGG